MADSQFDVLCIGNAIVDVIAHADDAFVADNGLVKGAMTLIDAERAEELYGRMGPGVECSGGSAGNTAAAAAALGSRAAYFGKVRDDQLGSVFRHDIRASGVAFDTAPANDGPPTARCLIVVTPDAERTMNTYLGACTELGPEDIDEDVTAAAQVTYMEGYLWDPPRAKDAFRKAMAIAHEHGRKVSLTLSDPFCVDRYREEFLHLVEREVDILFANEEEIISLYQAADFDEALQQVRGHCEIAALTRSEKGAVVISGDELHVIDAEPVKQVVDTTGAGDLYAAGFLHGWAQGWPLHDCGRAGGVCAAEIISHIGARPEADLKALMEQALGRH
jgi:sugar/nucleoside kinase (ribokinase family)